MTLGVLATINQRLDWEIIELLAEEFGYVAEKLEDVGEELFTLDHSDDDKKKLNIQTSSYNCNGSC